NPQKPTCTQNPRPRPHENPVTQARKIRDLQQVKVRPQNRRFDPCSDEPGRAGLKSPWEEIFHNRGKVFPPPMHLGSLGHLVQVYLIRWMTGRSWPKGQLRLSNSYEYILEICCPGFGVAGARVRAGA